jgi:hypothetical protein
MRKLLVALTVFMSMIGLTTIAQSAQTGYSVPLVSKELVFSNPTNSWSYWFPIRPGMVITGPPQVTLYYTYSDTLMDGTGSVTILLNDVPLISRKLPFTAAIGKPLVATFPSYLLKRGFNELRIMTRQRSIDGDCRDIDHAGNWLKISPKSTLFIPVSARQHYPIAMYPYPLLDTLAVNAVQSTWYLPPSPDKTDIAAMLHIASDWGSRESGRDLPIKISTGSPSSENGNQLIIGKTSSWKSLTDAQPSNGTGYVESLPTSETDQRARLLVTGPDPEGLLKAAHLLSTRDSISQLETMAAEISYSPLMPNPDDKAFKGTFTLRDLGYENLKLTGAWHQSGAITLKRPVRCLLGRDAKIKIKFRHSATLNPLRSLMTIKVNGLQVASTILNPENANDPKKGILEAYIPVTEVQKDTWVISFELYHDLGTLDCSKTYDDVAWTVIDGSSEISLTNGSIKGMPSLENFPYLVKSDGKLMQPVMWLSDSPTDAQLTAAARIAMRAGQQYMYPIDWRVVTGSESPGKGGNASAVIMIAYPGETDRFKELQDLALAIPDNKDSWKVKPIANVLMTSELVKAGLLQAFNSPWDKIDGVVYSVIVPNDAVLSRVSDTFSSVATMSELKNQLSVLTNKGRVVSIATRGANDLKAEIKVENTRYTPFMWGIFVIILIFVLLFLRWFVRNFIPKSKKRTSRPSQQDTTPPAGTAG